MYNVIMDYKTLIIDGNNFLYRAYFATAKSPKIMVNGVNTTPIHKFLYMLKILKETFTNVDEVFFTWDKRLNHGGENFRKTLTAYKEQRVETDDTRNIWEYCDLLQPVLDALGIYTIFPYNLEGDDVMSFIAQKSEKSLIVSSDKDLLQLICPNIHVYNPMKREVITPENFEEKVGLTLDQFVVYKSIFGDVADNIPGLDGYGKVKAGKLSKAIVESYQKHDLIVFKEDMLYDMATHVPSTKPNLEELGITEEQYTTICNNIKIGWLNYVKLLQHLESEWQSYTRQYDMRKRITFDVDALREYFNKYGFFNYTREFGQWVSLFNKNTNYELDFESLLKFV